MACVYVFYTPTLAYQYNLKEDNADKPNTSGWRHVI